MEGNSQAKSYKYKAFITYSHAVLSLAAALQSGLHSFAKRWYKLRAVRVFRDQTYVPSSSMAPSAFAYSSVAAGYF